MTLLTTAEYEALKGPTGLSTAALQILLDAGEAAIIERYGPVGDPVEEVHDGGQSYIFLRRRAATIGTVVETTGTTDTTLAANDYRLRGDGVSILRLSTGTHAGAWWGEPITVTYTPTDDTADRKRVQAELVSLMRNYTPGVTQESVGAWARTLASNSVWNSSVEREAILASLTEASLAPGFA